MKFRVPILLILLSFLGASLPAQTPNVVLSGNLQNLTGANPNPSAFVRFVLKNYTGFVPKVSGQAILLPNCGQFNTLCEDFSPTNGQLSGSIYGNDVISPGGTYYNVQFWAAGKTLFSCDYIVNGPTFNINGAACLSEATIGPANILGAQSFTCTVSTPSTTWTCNHNFANSQVIVECFDTTSKLLWPDTIVQTDLNDTTITFVDPQTGSCQIMSAGNSSTPANPNAVLLNPSAPQTLAGQPFNVQSPFNALDGGTLGGLYSGPTSLSNLNSVLYVGAAYGIGDIGAQINAAYAAFPTGGGGTIRVVPQVSGACYSYSTPIVMSTVGKAVILEGGVTSAASPGLNNGGACLLFTNLTGPPAITIDWCSTSTGCNYAQSGGIRDLTLLNSTTQGGTTPCETNGGCGVSNVTGLQIGGTNGGAMLADWKNLSVKGFKVGIDTPGLGSGLGWAQKFDNPSLTYNTIGMRLNGSEGITIIGGNITVNGTGIKLQNTASQGVTNLTTIGVHFDSNTILGIDGTSGGTCGQINLIADHFENLGTLNTAYVNCAGGAGLVNIIGGDALDDNVTGPAAPYWFTAYVLHAEGLSVYQNPGRPAPTSLFVLGSSTGYANIVNFAPTVLTGQLGLGNVVHTIVGPGISAQITSPHYQSAQANLPTAAWVAGGGSSSGLCSVGPTDTDTVGTVTCLTGTSATGTSGSINLNFFYLFTGTNAGCQWTLNQTGTGLWPSTTTLADGGTTNNIANVQWATNGAALPFNKTLSLNYLCVGR